MNTSVQRRQTAFRLNETLLEDLKIRAAHCNRSLNNLVESLLMQAMYDTQVLEDAHARMETYCKNHFDESFVSEMEAKDFLIGAPQPSNEHEFEDLDKMFREAEESGDCTEEEVAKMFAV